MSNQERMRKETIAVQLELAKKRCRGVIDRIEALPVFTSKINASCQRTLLKLAQSELSFLCRSSSALNSLRFVHSMYSHFILLGLFYYV